MRKYISLLCILFACFLPLTIYATTDTLEGEELTTSATIEGVATTDTVEGQVVKAGGASASDIVFWLNFEENDNSGDYNMGASECSDGDTSGAYTGSAVVNTDAALTGTYGLDSPSSGDYMTFVVSSGDIMNATACIIGFKLYINTWANLSTVFEYYLNGSNYFSLRLSNDGDDFYLYWYEGGVGKNITDIDVNLSATTEYYVEFFIDAANNVRKVRINGGSWVSDTTAFVGFAGTALYIAAVANANDIYVDQFIVSFDITTPRDLNAIKETATKLAGSCDG